MVEPFSIFFLVRLQSFLDCRGLVDVKVSSSHSIEHSLTPNQGPGISPPELCRLASCLSRRAGQISVDSVQDEGVAETGHTCSI